MPTTTRKRARPGDLIEAVIAGDLETVRRLIDAGSDILCFYVHIGIQCYIVYGIRIIGIWS
jgi:hypothetical protein